MAFKRNPIIEGLTIKLGGTDKTGKAFPKEIKGYYFGYRTLTNDYGVSRLHTFSTADGIVGVWGAANLNKQLETWPLGTMIIATNTMTKKKMGKFSGVVYDVQGDDEDMIEVPVEFRAQNASSVDSQDDSDVDQDVTDGDTDSAPADEVAVSRPSAPRQPVAAPSPANQARTKELLAKGRNGSARAN